MRAVIFANGSLTDPDLVRRTIHQDDILIAANGGARYCQALSLVPAYAIGDFDSLEESHLQSLERQGTRLVRFPSRKDFTDLELAVRHALSLKVDEILIFGALGQRWDQTLANLLLPAILETARIPVHIMDGQQVINLVSSAQPLLIEGCPGDTVSLIPVGGDAQGIQTQGLEYALQGETLHFGATRGVSNVLEKNTARIELEKGLLIVIVIHGSVNTST